MHHTPDGIVSAVVPVMPPGIVAASVVVARIPVRAMAVVPVLSRGIASSAVEVPAAVVPVPIVSGSAAAGTVIDFAVVANAVVRSSVASVDPKLVVCAPAAVVEPEGVVLHALHPLRPLAPRGTVMAGLPFAYGATPALGIVRWGQAVRRRGRSL